MTATSRGSVPELHLFERRLTASVLGNLSNAASQNVGCDTHFKKLDPRIQEHIYRDQNGLDDAPTLNDAEFEELEGLAFTVKPVFMPLPKGNRRGSPPFFVDWIAAPGLYRRHLHVAGEVGRLLGSKQRRQWCEFSANQSRKLQKKGLRLHRGIEIVHDWARYIRSLLAALDRRDLIAAPLGELSTPTCEGRSCDGEAYIDPHPNGPGDFHMFWYQGKSFELPDGLPGLLIVALWDAPRKRMDYKQLAKPVWDDEEKLLDHKAVDAAKKLANRFFRDSGIHYHISREKHVVWFRKGLPDPASSGKKARRNLRRTA